ncbi:MAG: polyprenyl synthetase family protein [Bifidobacteriaceae bacterium]|jgi:geranylgeranyl diphosphate synthase type I|nr:polyprenyl synthetase family protein [Bifidobacteriaceae bacterium]
MDRLGEFVELAQREREAHLAKTAHTLSRYGFPVNIGVDGVIRAGEGSNKVLTRLIGMSYLVHGGPSPNSPLNLRRMALAAAAHEMYQDASLAHDDLMDRSDTRRGRLSLHQYFAHIHAESNWLGESTHMGRCLALMIGDALLVASEGVFLEALAGVEGEAVEYMVTLHQFTRIEHLMGQSLDTVLPYMPDMDDPEKIIQRALDTVRTKTARYLIGTPLAVGAAGAGATRAESDVMMEMGMLLGEAYQLKDDIVGALGDPEVSGKPVGQDLVDGKRTVLVGLTMRLLDPAERRAFTGALLRGDAPPVEARVRHLQGVIRASGAVEHLEAMIADRREQAFEVLERSSLDASGRAEIRELADWFLTPARV